MSNDNIINLSETETKKLAERLQEAFNIYNGEMRKLTGYKDSEAYHLLIEGIEKTTGITISASTLRDLITLKHKGGFKKSNFDAIEKFIDAYSGAPSLKGNKNIFLPVKQKVFWSVNQGSKPGAFINSFKGAFIDWDDLKKELEKNVITQCPRIIPVKSKVALADFYGKKDWVIHIVDSKANIIGDIWLGGNPLKNWYLDGLVRIGFTISDTEWEVYQILQRYSDGSYRIIKSFV